MSAAPKTILVVDDNEDFSAMLKALLESKGYAVECATNGRQGLAAQHRRPASIVMTDLFMPESDGFEVIEALRREFPATRIVAMSGDATRVKSEYLPNAALIGADATLKKPFNAEQLFQLLRSLDAHAADTAAFRAQP